MFSKTPKALDKTMDLGVALTRGFESLDMLSCSFYAVTILSWLRLVK